MVSSSFHVYLLQMAIKIPSGLPSSCLVQCLLTTRCSRGPNATAEAMEWDVLSPQENLNHNNMPRLVLSPSLRHHPCIIPCAIITASPPVPKAGSQCLCLHQRSLAPCCKHHALLGARSHIFPTWHTNQYTCRLTRICHASCLLLHPRTLFIHRGYLQPRWMKSVPWANTIIRCDMLTPNMEQHASS